RKGTAFLPGSPPPTPPEGKRKPLLPAAQPGDLAVDGGKHALALICRNLTVAGKPIAGAPQRLGLLGRIAARTICVAGADDDAGAVTVVALVDLAAIGILAVTVRHDHHMVAGAVPLDDPRALAVAIAMAVRGDAADVALHAAVPVGP